MQHAPPQPAYGAHARRFATPIQHVVVIVQENRTVDYLFNGYPNADTVTIDPYTGTILKPFSLAGSCPPGASHGAFVAEYDGGAMDGFVNDTPKTCTAYAFAPLAEVKRYWSLAENNVLADETFSSQQSDSFAGHQYLYAGRGCTYPADTHCLADNANGEAYCGATGVTVPLMDMTSPYPGRESRYGPPCKRYAATIFSEATAAGLSWRYYTYDARSEWGGPSADKACWTHPACAANVVTPPRRVLADIAHHRLADLVYVTPELDQSDHPDAMHQATAGEDWVARVVDAIGADPAYWSTTTILLTWDDWGGWYDHVPPPSPPFYEDPIEYGFRVPLVVVSAYVTPGTVDHTQRNVFGSMLRYVETTFGLPSLQQVDAPGLTDDLSGLFNYGQAPNPFVPM